MKLSYIIPDKTYQFFGTIVPELREHFHVEINRIPQDTDLVLLGIFPITENWYEPLLVSGKPFILWHWDYYSFSDYRDSRWVKFESLLTKAEEVWSCSYEMARQLKELRNIDSYMMPAWVDSLELNEIKGSKGDFVLYASSSSALGKRVDWAQKACDLLQYRLSLVPNQKLTRCDYLRLLASCRVYVSTAFEESNATIPAVEAGALAKPVVLSDIPANKEVFGNTAYYFRNWDFGDLLKQLKKAWEDYPPAGNRCRARILKSYDISVVAPRIANRLREIHERI